MVSVNLKGKLFWEKKPVFYKIIINSIIHNFITISLRILVGLRLVYNLQPVGYNMGHFCNFHFVKKSPSLIEARKIWNKGVLSSSKKSKTKLLFIPPIQVALLRLSDLKAVSKVRSWWFIWVSTGDKYWLNVYLHVVFFSQIWTYIPKKVLNSSAVAFLSDIIPFSVLSVLGRDCFFFWIFPVILFKTCHRCFALSLCFSNRFE